MMNPVERNVLKDYVFPLAAVALSGMGLFLHFSNRIDDEVETLEQTRITIEQHERDIDRLEERIEYLERNR